MWKQIILNNIKTNYSVSDSGEVRNDTTNKLLKGSLNKGYRMVSIYINKNPHPIGIHRLVALMFIDNPNNYPFVNHIDGNPLNNNISNLEWCTPQYNTQHAIRIGLKTNFKTKKVRKYAENGEFIEEYISLTKAAQDNDCSISKIIEVCKGNRKTTAGYQWRYSEDNVDKLEPVKANPQGAKMVAQIDPKTDEVIAIYSTIHEAAKAVNGTQSAITHVLKGDKHTKTHKGFKWKSVEEIVQ